MSAALASAPRAPCDARHGAGTDNGADPRTGPDRGTAVDRKRSRVPGLAAGGVTLEQRLERAFAAAMAADAAQAAACPVCSGPMAPDPRGGEATCRDCGSVLT